MDDTSIPYENKSGLLRHTITEQPAKWIHLLRDLPHESQYITAIAGYVPAPLMLQGMAKTDFYQTSVLSQLMEQLQHQEEKLSRIVGSSPFPAACTLENSAALLAGPRYIRQDTDS